MADSNSAKNWKDFVGSVHADQINDARIALVNLIAATSIHNESFLDAAYGSGIVSLAAQQLGAERIHYFDFDQDSVDATLGMMTNSESGQNWIVEQGSLTDSEYLNGPGQFDTVCSWGVIHQKYHC